METIAISKFKATCLAVLEQVRQTGKPVLVTRRGVPVAQLLPPPPSPRQGSAFGCMAETATEVEDILMPFPEEEWEVLR